MASWLETTLVDGTTPGRSGGSATTAWSPIGRSTGSMPTPSSRWGGRSSPRSMPRTTAARRVDPVPTRPRSLPRRGRPGRLRRRPRGLPDGHAPRPPAPHRSGPRDDPGRRAHRGHRDARVPAQCRAVRSVLLAGPVRRRPDRRLCRPPSVGAGSEAIRERGVRLDRRHGVTRPTRAITSSSMSPGRHPSLGRLLTDAPEFVEGWGMYSELDAPRARLR